MLKALIKALTRRPVLSLSALTSVIAVFGGTEIRDSSAGGRIFAPLFLDAVVQPAFLVRLAHCQI
ncbi:hypothetical protein [Variovorax sp. UMC13]|uniref:hypothetical protein n=1 Tax=Variovorax sp. UMC13 TaxID=1862326 RepID=UPI001C7FF3B4|nr:hypothetical protein [Variovorax sp. UMC13]